QQPAQLRQRPTATGSRRPTWRCAARVRPGATATGPRPPHRNSSTHLLGCGDTHQREAATNDLRDSEREFQPRTRKLWIFFNEEAPFRIVITAVPQRMEFGGEVVQIECDTMRF